MGPNFGPVYKGHLSIMTTFVMSLQFMLYTGSTVYMILQSNPLLEFQCENFTYTE